MDLRKCGSMEQIAYARRIQFQEGRAAGLQAVEVKAGVLRYLIALDKCMDIAEASYEGVNLNFLSRQGLQNRQPYDTHGIEAQRSIMGGLFFTCGTDNVGTPEEEKGLPMHGTLRSTPASQVGIDTFWKDEKYHIAVRGQMRQAALFGENILLKRTIETTMDMQGRADAIRVHDVFMNEACTKAPFMLLYHCNLGYPLLDSGCHIDIPTSQTVLRGENTATDLPWQMVDEPKEGIMEQVFFHQAKADPLGRVTVRMYNEKLGKGLAIIYRQDQLPRLTQWKSMAAGDYVVGIEPCNCHVNGQTWEREHGSLMYIMPGEQKETELEFHILHKIES